MGYKIKAMHDEFGKKEGHKCKECSNLYRYNYKSIMLKKCTCYGLTHSSSTDWNLNFIACGLFNKYYDGKKVIEMAPHKTRKHTEIIEEPIDGQINIFDILNE